MRKIKNIKNLLFILLAFGILFATIPAVILNIGTQNSNKSTLLAIKNFVLESIVDDASEALSTGYGIDRLERKLETLVKQPIITSIKITDNNGNIQLESKNEDFDLEDSKVYSRDIYEYLGERLTDDSEPFKVGHIYLSINSKQITKTYYQTLKLNLVFVLIDVIIITFLIHLIFIQRVIKPSRQIMHQLEKNLTNPEDKRSLEHLYGDEIGQIAEKVDDFIIKLCQINEQKTISEHQSRMSILASEEKAKIIKETTKRIEDEKTELITQIHNDLNPSILFSNMKINSMLKNKTFPSSFHPTLKEIISQLDTAYTTARNISKGIRPDMNDHLGIREAIQDLIDYYQSNTEIKISFHTNGDSVIQCSKNEEILLYRIVKEAILNSIKHAQCKKITINMLNNQQETTLLIKDDGIGFNDQDRGKEGIGILLMKEYAKNIGSELNIQSSSESGTVITIKVSNNG